MIFTTAYDAYALEAFQVHSIDYLLKPISFSKLQHAFQKLEAIQEAFQKTQQTQKLDKVLNSLEEKGINYKSRFLVKSGSRLLPVSIDQVSYFLSEDRITFLVTRKNKRYMINHTLDELEEMIDPAEFFRINRQMILHINSIQVIHKYFKGRLKVEVAPPPEEDVMVSSRRVADFQAWLDR